ncbi:MAG TPA: MXAN_5187 C-terminal domain-containing protein [Kofleriaceae bacterium]
MASKSLQQEPEKAEVIEEALDLLDQTLDRVKVLYEQYFLGIQKQPPQFLHTDVERKLRDIAQLQIRNTALRYRFVTLQQKFGSYNAYWRRTLRQIENGTYLRNLSKLTRMAAQTGEEIPEEILAAMPKRMREQVRRDREAALAIAARRHQVARDDDDEPEMTIEGLPDNQSDPFDPPTDLRRKTAKTAGGAHIVDEADGDLDLDAFFAEMEKNPTRPPPIANPALARARTRERDRDKTGNLPVIGRTKTHSSSPSGAHAVVADPTRPKRAPTAQPPPPRGEPVSRPATAPIVGRSDTDFDLDPPTDLRRKPQPPPQTTQVPRPAPVQQTTQVPRPAPVQQPAPRPTPLPQQMTPQQTTQIPRPVTPAQTTQIPRPAPSQQTTPIPRQGPPQTTPFSRPIPAIPIPAIPPVPERPQTSQTNITFKSPMAPSQVTRPNPIVAGSAASQETGPVETLSGPFPAAKPAPQPNVPRPAPRAPAGRHDPGARTPAPQRAAPPPGMTDADVNALYAKYVKAKEMVGQTAGPGAYGKLLQTINAQAPKIMEQYKAKGVDFSVVVKDNQVIIRAKPKP